MRNKTCFAWISNELNNLPLCLGSKYRDLGSLDLLTTAVVGLCTIENPTPTLEKMEDVFQAWWNSWYNEKLEDFVVKPTKWYRLGPATQVGDTVSGRVIQMVPLTVDNLIREVVVEYENATEKLFRMTCRAAWFITTLFSKRRTWTGHRCSSRPRDRP
jgi:hypothetical protein